MRWIHCFGALAMLLSLSAPAQAGLLGGHKCGTCGPSCQPKGCQPACGAGCQEKVPCTRAPWCKPPCHPPQPQCCKPCEPIYFSTCFTPPRPVCICPPQKCCPPEIEVKNCSCLPPVILPPPPCHVPIAPPTICCEEECSCGSSCAGGCGAVPLVPADPSAAPAPPMEEAPAPAPETAGRAHTHPEQLPGYYNSTPRPRPSASGLLRIFK